MKDNKIRLVLDKKNIIIGDSSLDLTDKIIELLNKDQISKNRLNKCLKTFFLEILGL